MKKIYIIGGANIDIIAYSNKRVVSRDSNPGKIKYTFGGVGHNIAVNLAKMGCEVAFITAFSQDVFGQMLIQDCEDAKLDISNSQMFADERSSIYLAIAEPDGDMNVAVADMDILDSLDVYKLVPFLNSLDNDDMVVIDTNLSVSQIGTLVNSCKGKIYVDPISTTKAEKILDYLNKLEMLKPNLLEAQQLSGIQCNCENDYLKLVDYFLEKGVKNILISLGSEGAIAGNSKEVYRIGKLNVEVVNTTGAGDSFMAGFMYGQYKGCDFLKSLKYATASSSIAISSKETVNPYMSEDLLEKYYQRVENEVEVKCLRK